MAKTDKQVCEEAEAEAKKMPEKKFRAGSVSATIWLNKGKSKNGDDTEFRNITIERNYRDQDDDWQTTNSFRLNDLPRVALVAQKAYEYLVLGGLSAPAALEGST